MMWSEGLQVGERREKDFEVEGGMMVEGEGCS